jgi:prepilin-type processing-associated H-X9-DG protein
MTSRVIRTGSWQRIICVVLAVTMAVGPSLNVVAQTTTTETAPVKTTQPVAAAAGTIDTKYITPGASAVVVLRPAQLMKSPLAEMLPVEVATAAGLKYLGVDPANVEEVVAFVDLANPTAAMYGVTLKFAAPIRAADIPEQLRAHTQRDEIAGRAYLKSQQPMLPSLFAPNGKTLVVAPDVVVQQFAAPPTGLKSGPVIDRVQKVSGGNDLYVAINVTSLRPLLQMGLAASGKPIPPEAKPFLDALNLIDAAELTVNLSKAGTTSLVAHANDAAAAEQIEKILADSATMYQEKMKASLAKQKDSDDPIERAMAQYAERVSGRWSQPFMPARDGAQLTFFRTEGTNSQQQQLVTVAVVGVLVALLLPAVQAAREAARRNVSMNNMKQMMLAFHNFHDARKKLPAHAIYSAEGKPLLSWRVQILPYIEEQALYQQFHLDEPWDSEHNRALIPLMPAVFANPNLPSVPGKTNYLAVVGKECIFDGTAKGMGFRNITDGTSKTIMLVEANADQAVDWTKPDDLKYDAQNPSAGLGGLRPGGFNAAFADGHVAFIANSIDKQVLNSLFTRAGKEIVNDPN